MPAVIGNLPFGLITGAAAISAGVDPWLGMAMSIIVFAGAAQLAAMALMAQHAPAAIVVLTVLVVNLRMMMYSAAIAPYFRRTPTLRKWLFSYVLTDNAFLLVTTKFSRDDVPKHLDAYYFGATGIMWCCWQLSVAVGIFFGTMVPAAWSLDFAIPLMFLSLLLPALQSKSYWATAIASSVAAAFCTALPLKLGLIAAAATGVCVGTWMDRNARAKVAS
jgi:4-azaleucine resistance transporter AzlC